MASHIRRRSARQVASDRCESKMYCSIALRNIGKGKKKTSVIRLSCELSFERLEWSLTLLCFAGTPQTRNRELLQGAIIISRKRRAECRIVGSAVRDEVLNVTHTLRR